MNPETIRALLGRARVGRLATLDPDGRPNLVPFVFAMDGDTLYSCVDEKPKRSPDLARIRNLRERPNAVAVLVDHYEEDWSKLWWVRLRGSARLLEDGTERDRALALLRERYGQYATMPDLGAVIALDVSEWRGWSARPLE